MGTDIHSVVQIRDNGWRTIICRPLEDSRCYNTFSLFANVRNGIRGFPWIFEPRGYPEDFKVEEDDVHPVDFVWYNYWDVKKTDPRTEINMGYHDHSWFTLKEFEDFWNLHKDKLSDLTAPQMYIDELHRIASENNVGPDSIRLVFGFDS